MRYFKTYGPLILTLLALAGLLANIFLAPLYAWAATLFTMLCLVGFIGRAIKGRWDGIVINTFNRVSLSRLQALAWSLLVFSTIAAVAAYNLRHGQSNGLSFIIPDQLIAATGLSLATLAATPAVLNAKTQQMPAGDIIAQTDALTPAGAQGAVVALGKVVARQTPADASWLDLFRGDELGDAASPDLAKIQHFLITLVLLGAYGGAVATLLRNSGVTIGALPPLSSNFVWLLGVSHAGYILSKAAPHTPSA